MTDFQHTQFDPHGSHRKMLHVLLTHLPPRYALTFFPTPQRATSQTVESSSLQGARTGCIQFERRRESEYITDEKSTKGKSSSRAETRTCGTDSPSRSKSRELSITPLHHPQIKRWLNDGLQAPAIRSTRESSEDVFTYS